MDESSLNILVEGDSSGAVQAFDSLDTSVSRFGGQLDTMKTQMTSPYEHAGLFIFSRQVLGLAGLSDVARHAMGAITLGFEDMAASVGLTVAAIAPYLLVLGLGIVAVEKWMKGHKDATTAMDELLAKEQGSIKTKEDLIEKIDAYAAATGRLTPELRDLRQATIDQAAAERAQAEATAQSLVTSLGAQLAANEKAQAAAQAAIAVNRQLNETYANGAEEHVVNTAAIDIESQRLAKLTADHLDLHAKSAQAIADLKALKDGFASADDEMDRGTKSAAENQKAIEELDKFQQKLAEDVGRAAQQMNAAQTKLATDAQKLTDEDAAYTENAWDRKSAAAKRALDQTLASIETTYRKAQTEAQAYGIDDAALTTQYEASKAAARKLYEDKADADARAFFGLQATMMQGLEQTGVSTFNQLNNGISASFAKMVVEGKSMAVSLDQVFKNVAESFISAVSEMMIKWAAFKAFTGILGGFSGDIGGAPTGASSGAAATYGSGITPSFAGEFATGGDFLVDRPTTFIAGEAGAERVLIMPTGGTSPSSGGSGSGGGDMYVTVNVPGAGDPAAVAQRVVDYLMQQTKGRGQVNPIGASIYGR